VEATGYIEYVTVCPCGFPNPAPLCETHYRMAELYLIADGPSAWQCGNCGHLTDVVGVYRKNR
jgi:hypothetical protein